MSNQPENENLQAEIVTPEEVRQSMLAEIDATQQAINELSEEELEEVAGGLGLSLSGLKGQLQTYSRLKDHWDAYGDHYKNLFSSIKGISDTRASRRPMPPTEPMR